MANKRVMVAAACFLASGLGARADERPFAFTAVDFPGAVSTTAWGINGQGEVVGSYVDVAGPAGRQHGFVLSGETFRSIDFPGSVLTDARGISPAGDVVGAYRAGAPTMTHGYVLTRHGEFLQADFPGHMNTILQRIAPDGTIVGCYHDTDTMGTMHGIVITGEDSTALDMPASMHNGVTPDLTTIVGLYTDMDAGKGRAYLLRNGDFVPFDVPGSTFTAGWDINPGGDVVGAYFDAAGFHGFVVDTSRQDAPSEWAFTAIDYPGATATRAFGINAGGDVVGSYVDATGRSHGFLASRTAGHNQ